MVSPWSPSERCLAACRGTSKRDWDRGFDVVCVEFVGMNPADAVRDGVVYSGGRVRRASVSLLLEWWPACCGCGGMHSNAAAAEEFRRLCSDSIGLPSSHGRFLPFPESMGWVCFQRMQARSQTRHPLRLDVGELPGDFYIFRRT
jgi:hypothetical protein